MTLQQRSVLPTRLHCLDNVRYLVVLGVIVFHSTSAYVGAPYFVMDPHPGQFTRWLNSFLISFIMDVLFFVAGYFALASLERKGVVRFICSKITRLGIPFLLGVFFIAPISTYIAYAAQKFSGLESTGYWGFWRMYMGTIPEFPTARIGGAAFSAWPQFHYHHFWFLAELLSICVVFALLWGLRRRVLGADHVFVRDEATSTASVSLALLAFAGIGTLSTTVGQWFAALPGTGPVLTVLGGSQWQILGVGVHFGAGAYAYSKRWFVNGTYPGPLVGWVLLWIVVMLSGELTPQTSWYAIQDVLYIGLLSGLAFRYMNRPSRINESLAANSYPMFIIHYPIVVLLQYLLLDVGAPTTVKFLICAATAIAVTWAISNYLIRPLPRVAAAALIALFAVMAVAVHPARPAGAAATMQTPAFAQPSRPGFDAIADARLRWFDSQIDLTEEQKEALKPLLMDQVRVQLEADQAFRDTLEKLLDEDQLERYQRMMRR